MLKRLDIRSLELGKFFPINTHLYPLGFSNEVSNLDRGLGNL